MEDKIFQFDFKGTINGYGVVSANSEEEAIEKIKNNKYDDIIDTWDMEIKDITEIEEKEQ